MGACDQADRMKTKELSLLTRVESFPFRLILTSQEIKNT